MHFLRSPLEILPRAPGCRAAGAAKVGVNTLQAQPDGSQRAVSTGETETLPVRFWYERSVAGRQLCPAGVAGMYRLHASQSQVSNTPVLPAGILKPLFFARFCSSAWHAAQADLVLTSIGYKTLALEGVAFDAARGVVLHRCAPTDWATHRAIIAILFAGQVLTENISAHCA